MVERVGFFIGTVIGGLLPAAVIWFLLYAVWRRVYPFSDFLSIAAAAVIVTLVFGLIIGKDLITMIALLLSMLICIGAAYFKVEKKRVVEDESEASPDDELE